MSETTSTISLDAELENNFAHIAKTANTSESEQVHKLMRDHIDKKQTHPSFMPPENCTDEEYDAWYRERVANRTEFGECGKSDSV